MENQPHHPHHKKKHKLIFPIIFTLIFLGGIRLMPWDKVNWGKVEMLPGSAITVTGEAKKNLKNQIATFSVSVAAIDNDKQVATNEVNTNMTDIIKKIKDFGINDPDIKTQNISVHRQPKQRIEPSFAPPIPIEEGEDEWRASNSINITLRDLDKASSFADLLQETKATSVSGPRLSLDDTTDSQAELLESAIEDAREKAEVIAKASDRKLGKVLTVSESGAQPIMYRGLEMATSSMDSTPTPVEPGSQTVYKSVTVVFELR